MTGAAIGITQGRLVPMVDGQIQRFPGGAWREEVDLVARAGYDGLEWIHDEFGAGVNPIGEPGGSREIAAACVQAGTRVLSGCFDDTLNGSLWAPGQAARWDPLLSALRRLAENLAALGASHLVLPLLRDNDIRDANVRPAAVRFVREVMRATDSVGVGVHLETALRSQDLLPFVDAIGDERCGVTFDMGNLVQFGYDPVDELEPLLPVIGSVHVKDSTVAAGTVPLGTGAVDFVRILHHLASFGYRGAFVVQGARVAGRADLDLCREYAGFVRGHLAPQATAADPACP